MITHSLSAVSFRDPGGFVYEDRGCIFRQVNLLAKEHYDHLMSSGLYRELTESGLLIRHEETDAPPPVPACAYRVIRPDRVAMISYPYEWSFSQYKDAALLTLAVQRQALAPRDVLEGLQRLQRAVPRGPAGSHRHALAGAISRGDAVGGLPTVLPAFSGPAGPDVVDRHPPWPACSHQP